LAIGCLSEFRNLRVQSALGLHVLRASLELFERIVNEREESLATFLDAELTPAVKLVGSAWPGREALEGWLSNTVMPQLRTLNGYNRNHALGIFVGCVGSGLPEVAESLRRLVKHEDGGVQCLVVHALSEYERGRPENMELLKWFEKTAAYGVARSFALRYLAESWIDGRGIKRLILSRAKREQDQNVQEAALELTMQYFGEESTTPALIREAAISGNPAALRPLAQHFHDDPATAQLLQDAVRGGSASTRGSAVVALAEFLRDDSQTLPLLQEAARSDDIWVHHSAVTALARHFADDPETFPLLAELARGTNYGQQRAVIDALAFYLDHDARSLPLLQELVSVENEVGIREHALTSIARAFPDDPGTRPLLETTLHREVDEMRATALEALATWVYSEQESRPLLDRLAREDESENVRGAALSSLISLFRDDTTLELLHHVAVQDESPSAEAIRWGRLYPREVALEGLVVHWPDERRTIPLLRDRAANDPVEWLRERASQWLAGLTGDE
jgi:hypothetical protein